MATAGIGSAPALAAAESTSQFDAARSAATATEGTSSRPSSGLSRSSVEHHLAFAVAASRKRLRQPLGFR